MVQAPAIRDYFNELMRVVKSEYVFRDRANWTVIDVHIEMRIAKLEQSPTDGYNIQIATNETLQEVNKHSFLAFPRPVSTEAQPYMPEMPQGEMREGIAYLSLPSCPSYLTLEEKAEYAQRGQYLVLGLLAQNPAGFVVDLSNNGGGDCHPMLAALSPLLDAQTYVGWADANGTIVSGVGWNHEAGYAVSGGDLCTYLPSFPCPPNRSMPVSVVIGENTCSSGEVTALALKGSPLVRIFGQASAGYSTSNQVLDTPFPETFGRHQYALTTGVMADRDGTLYGDRILPDVITDQPYVEAVAHIRQQAAQL